MAAAPKTVVAAVDGSAGSEQALQWVAANAAPGGVKVLVCLPVQDGAYVSRGAALEAQEAFRRRFSEAQVCCRPAAAAAIGKRCVRSTPPHCSAPSALTRWQHCLLCCPLVTRMWRW